MKPVETTRVPAVRRVRPPLPLIRMINPAMRWILTSPLHGLVSRHVLLLQLTGRRTGRRYAIPIGYHGTGSPLTLITSSKWRCNLRGGAGVRVVLRGRRRLAQATLFEDPDAVASAYREVIERLGWKAAQRQLGIRIAVGRTPTVDELADAVRRSGLALIRLDLL